MTLKHKATIGVFLFYVVSWGCAMLSNFPPFHFCAIMSLYLLSLCMG